MAEFISEHEFVAAFKRKFRAREIPATAGNGDSAESPDAELCALCQRASSGMTYGTDGRPYCRDVDADQCTRIALGRLGASATAQTASRSLKGHLHPDGKCRSCGEPIKWVKTQKGKNMPVDVQPARADVAAFELVGRVDTLAFYISEKRRAGMIGDVYESHFQTCAARDTEL